jgi:hypothetical protein
MREKGHLFSITVHLMRKDNSLCGPVPKEKAASFRQRPRYSPS